MRNLEIRKLDWDSVFWEVDIYDIKEDSNLTCNEINLEFPQNKSSYLIQELVSVDNVEYINQLEALGFRFVESKINLAKKVKDFLNTPENIDIKTVKTEDLDNYKNEFFELYGEVSRFSMFGENKVNQFYYKWVIESINGNLDDGCFGYYFEDELAGFITYRIINQKLIIGLVGVFYKFQGRKISQHLLQYINNYALENSCSEIYISTQGKNTRAINAYIKSGFYIEGIKNWYYLLGGQDQNDKL